MCPRKTGKQRRNFKQKPPSPVRMDINVKISLILYWVVPKTRLRLLLTMSFRRGKVAIFRKSINEPRGAWGLPTQVGTNAASCQHCCHSAAIGMGEDSGSYEISKEKLINLAFMSDRRLFGNGGCKMTIKCIWQGKAIKDTKPLGRRGSSSKEGR